MKQLIRFSLTIVIAVNFLGPAHGEGTQPEAWYAEGQIWVVWTADTKNTPQTYAIYASVDPFTDTADANLVGRLFRNEWAALNLIDQLKDSFGSPAPLDGYRIPDEDGESRYVLKADEGLFVQTARESGSRYYSVVPWGQTDVPATCLTTASVPFTASPSDPPRPQLQYRGESNAPHLGITNMVSFYVLFVDGSPDLDSGRPDFPILASGFKRGSPHLFLTAEPNGGLPGDGPYPGTLCFHGANGDAVYWLPNNPTAESVGMTPTDGYLISVDDELFCQVDDIANEQNTRWLGYVPSYNPFTNIDSKESNWSIFNPPPGETIVNYTQRRINYILDWLAANKDLDPDRVSVIGHSNGSMGAQMYARAFPERVSVAQLYNCGMRYNGFSVHIARQGDENLNLPVTLTNRAGGSVRMLDMFSITNNITPSRDLPFIRHYHGKCDDNGANSWGADMLAQMRDYDARGEGLHFYWDLRNHGRDRWEDYWVDSNNLALQTRRDDVRNLSRYRAAQSYPAFYNLANLPDHLDPGPGYIGSSTPGGPCRVARDENDNVVDNGDNHGTWGGYFDWDTNTIIDTHGSWQCEVFLTGNATAAAIDRSPHPTLTANVAIRKPQQLLPAAGTRLLWSSRDPAGPSVVRSGFTEADADGVVRMPAIEVPRHPATRILRVDRPPRVTIHRTGTTTAILRATLPRGFLYRYQRSTDLQDWMPVGSVMPGADAEVETMITLGATQEYFRLSISPE